MTHQRKDLQAKVVHVFEGAAPRHEIYYPRKVYRFELRMVYFGIQHLQPELAGIVCHRHNDLSVAFDAIFHPIRSIANQVSCSPVARSGSWSVR